MQTISKTITILERKVFFFFAGSTGSVSLFTSFGSFFAIGELYERASIVSTEEQRKSPISRAVTCEF
jgi:hypothetical protein